MSDERQHVSDPRPEAGPRQRRTKARRGGGPERYPPVRRDDSIESIRQDDCEDIEEAPSAKSEG